MARTTTAAAIEPGKPGPAQVSDAELEDIVGGTACCACSDLSCRL
jgi:hypothetical protein